MKNILILFVFLQLIQTSTGQVIKFEKTPFWKFLSESDITISDITCYPEIYDLSKTIKDPRVQVPLCYKIIKNQEGLYIVTDGAGFVYKATVDSNLVNFKQVDSTLHFGYNLGALKFSHDNKLYAFGGYGFWHLNTYLLNFELGKDWQEKELNTKVPYCNNLYFLTHNNSKVYFLSDQTYVNKPNAKLDGKEVYAMDLKNFTLKYLGELNKEFDFLKNVKYCINFPSLNGSMIQNQNNFYLVCPQENKVYKLKSDKILDKLTHNLMYNPNRGFAFTLGNMLYYTWQDGKLLDSIKIVKEDFIVFSNEFYDVTTCGIFGYNKIIIISIIGFLVSILIFYCLLYYRRKNKHHVEIKQFDVKTPFPTISYDEGGFSEFENIFINTIINSNRYFSVDEINELLGLKKKTPDFKKKIRTESISKINVKFRNLSGFDEDLIIRIRSIDDKRFILYTINESMKKHYLNFSKKDKT